MITCHVGNTEIVWCGNRWRAPSGLSAYDITLTQGCALGFHGEAVQAVMLTLARGLTPAFRVYEIDQRLHVINRRLLQHAVAEIEDVTGAVVGGIQDRARLDFDRVAVG